MPYDPVVAPGRPIFRFVASRAGRYQVGHLTRNSTVAIVPDYTTGAEKEILLVTLLEVAVLATVVQWIVGRRRRAREARIESLLAPGRVSPKELQARHAEKYGGRPPE